MFFAFQEQYIKMQLRLMNVGCLQEWFQNLRIHEAFSMDCFFNNTIKQKDLHHFVEQLSILQWSEQTIELLKSVLYNN